MASPVLPGAEKPAGIPADYSLLYEQDFESPNVLQGFVMTDPSAWQLSKKNGNTALELSGKSKYEPPFRSPFNIALIADEAFGDFVLEANLLQTGKEYGHRDMCIFYDVQSPDQFYYTHLATAADPHAHNIFIVNHAPRTAIATKTTKGIDWGHEQWHKLRLERKGSDGTIRVFFDDMTKPIMTANDKTFQSGYIGFGSFDDTGMVDNIRIWGRSVKTRRTTLFKPATGN